MAKTTVARLLNQDSITGILAELAANRKHLDSLVVIYRLDTDPDVTCLRWCAWPEIIIYDCELLKRKVLEGVTT